MVKVVTYNSCDGKKSRITPGQISKGEPRELFQFHGYNVEGAKSELFPLEFRDKQEAVLETHQELQTWKLSISRSWKTTFGDTGGV